MAPAINVSYGPGQEAEELEIQYPIICVEASGVQLIVTFGMFPATPGFFKTYTRSWISPVFKFKMELPKVETDNDGVAIVIVLVTVFWQLDRSALLNPLCVITGLVMSGIQGVCTAMEIITEPPGAIAGIEKTGSVVPVTEAVEIPAVLPPALNDT